MKKKDYSLNQLEMGVKRAAISLWKMCSFYQLRLFFSLQMLRHLMPQHDLPTSTSLLSCTTPAARPTETSLRVLQMRYMCYKDCQWQNIISEKIKSPHICLWTHLTERINKVKWISVVHLSSDRGTVFFRSTSLCLRRWRPWWIQATWEFKSEASPQGVWWSTSPSSSPQVKAKTSAMCPMLCCTPWWTAPSTQWIKITQA